MRFALLASSAIALAAIAPAKAADGLIPVKAPGYTPASSCTPLNCSGWVVGIGAAGQGSNLNIIGGGIQNSVFAGGGAIGLVGGYQFWNGIWYIGPNVGLYYDLSPNSQVSTPGGAVGTAPSVKYLFTEGIEVGMPIGALIGQTSQPIAILASLSQALLSPFAQFGAAERPWGTGWYVGAGATFLLASDPRAGAWLLKVDYKAIDYSGGTVSSSNVGSTKVGTENWVGFSLVHKL